MPALRAGQSWATFPRNHAHATWACDFLPATNLLFRPLHAFVVVAHGSRRVVHVGVTRHPTAARVAQRRRAPVAFSRRLRYLRRDNDRKDRQAFARVAAATGITGRRPAYRAPRQNATGARFLGSVRRACRDHPLILGEAHLRRVLREDVRHLNGDRPQQGVAHQVPVASRKGPPPAATGGLHQAYARAA